MEKTWKNGDQTKKEEDFMGFIADLQAVTVVTGEQATPSSDIFEFCYMC